MISGMPIGYGDEVRVIFIKKSPHNESGCLVHSYSLYSPVSPPIRAKYDDYGRAIPLKAEKNLAAFTLDVLNKDLAPVEQGKNEYHDFACKSLNSFDFLLDACHSSRFFLKNPYSSNPASPATRVMIREDVWQAMLKHTFPVEWFREKAATIKTYHENALEYFRIFLPKPSTVSEPGISQDLADFRAYMDAERSTENGRNSFHYHFYGEGYAFIIKTDYFGEIKRKFHSNEWNLETPQFLELAHAFAELAFIQDQFDALGIMWGPMMTSGQEQHWDESVEFYSKMVKLAKKHAIEAEFEADGGDVRDAKDFKAWFKEKKKKSVHIT
jgi:hypothetical protein